MAKQRKKTSANLGFEDKLWAAADKLRGNMDAKLLSGDLEVPEIEVVG